MVFQPGLFAPEPLSLVNDAEGGIRYLPDSIPAIAAQQWFEQLLENIGWVSQQRMMYDREVAVPRLLATFAREAEDLPAPLGEAFEAVRALLGAPFNRVGLNLYRDGNDSVALHGDKTVTGPADCHRLARRVPPYVDPAKGGFRPDRACAVGARQLHRHELRLAVHP
jgi:alkylated DNA repair dioxygenase AlkB